MLNLNINFFTMLTDTGFTNSELNLVLKSVEKNLIYTQRKHMPNKAL